jgi:lipopolysaccharide heptosyltransferase I
VRLSALGDVLHALPVLAALRARFPDARIDWAVEDRAADLVRHRPDLDAVHVFPRRALSGALRRLPPRPVRLTRTAAGFVRAMRAVGYDAALDLQGNFKSGVVTRLSGAALRYGFDRSVVREANQVFTHRRALPPAGARHHVERNLSLASALVGERLPYRAPGFPTRPEHAAEAGASLARAGAPADGFVLLHPGTSGFGSFKRWPTDHYAALARGLLAGGHAVVISHAPAEAPLARVVADGTDRRAVALATPSLPVLAEVIGRARLFVAADTGPLHLAGLVGTPLLGLYGPKDPGVYGPYGLREDGSVGLLQVLTQDDVACRPCTLRRCADPLCMETMAPERVHAEARRALG